MRRSFLSVLALIVLLAESVVAQSTAPPRKLESIPHQLEAHPEGLDPEWTIELDSIVQSATIAEIRQVLPALVSLTESPNAQLRGNALLALYAIAARNKAGLAENRGEPDLMADEAMIPYLSRLEPRLMDSATQSRALSLLLFQALAAIRPTPPELIKVALTVLKSPQSTQPMPDTTHKGPTGITSSPGSLILWVLLPAAADFYRDPATNITEGRDSPEVQEAIIQFLHRSDQTTESLSESIRALALAQPQNPAVNAELLPLLNSSDVSVQKALLRNIARLTLSSEDFATARARVTSIATNPNTPMDLRQIASSLLPCWSNDRHHDVCPDL
jgi:hypothetical protein